MKANSLQLHLLTGIWAIALVAPAWSAQAAIAAQLVPQSIGLGEAAQLAVTVKGSGSTEPNMPNVDGLDITPVGQQSSVQILNGAVSANVTHIYQVTPNRAGNFTISAISAAGAGSTQPVAFRVDTGKGGQTQRAPSHGLSQFPPPRTTGGSTTPIDTNNESAFLRVVLPKQDLTVGELVPVEVKAYFRAGVSASLNGLPMLSSDAFALNKLSDQPEQARESINGVPYTVVTWTSALSAVKAGDYPLNLDLPVMVRVKERARPRSGGGRDPFTDFFGEDSPFGDSFFDNFFGGMTEKPLTLHTDGALVKIKALPVQGRPASFSGAVGEFDVSSEATSTDGTTGDPLTLKINVTGRGNFDRVTTAGLVASAEWKTYKPSAKFDVKDSSNTSGTKSFEQSVVPVKAGVQEIPAVSFSYFDPETQSYVTKKTAPIAVQIAQNTASAVAVTVPADTATRAPKVAADGLAPDEPVPAHASGSLRPLVLRPWFILVNAGILAATIIGQIASRVRARRSNHPERLEREAAERAVNESLAVMDAALKVKDVTRFFGAARDALQERLAAQWHVPASQVTIPEIRTRLNGHGETVSAVFQAADEIAYSGKRFTAPDLEQWRDLVKNELHQLAHG